MADKTKYKACYVDAVKTDGTWEVNDLHTFFTFETSSHNVKRSFMRNLHKQGMNFPRHFQFVEDEGEYKVVKRDDLKPILLITIEPPIEVLKIEA